MSSQTMRRLFNSSWPLAIFLASAECFQRTSGESCSPAFQADSADFYDPMRGQVCSFLAEVLLRWNDVELALCAMAWCQRGPHRESLRYWRGHAPLLHRAAPRCTALHRAAPAMMLISFFWYCIWKRSDIRPPLIPPWWCILHPPVRVLRGLYWQGAPVKQIQLNEPIESSSGYMDALMWFRAPPRAQ